VGRAPIGIRYAGVASVREARVSGVHLAHIVAGLIGVRAVVPAGGIAAVVALGFVRAGIAGNVTPHRGVVRAVDPGIFRQAVVEAEDGIAPAVRQCTTEEQDRDRCTPEK
jgi:hypothetical protein